MISILDLIKLEDIRKEIYKYLRTEHIIFLHITNKNTCPKRYKLNMKVVCQNAIADNSLSIIKYLYEHYRKDCNNIYNLINIHKNLDILKYIYPIDGNNVDNILFGAIICNNVDIVEYLCIQQAKITDVHLTHVIQYKNISTTCFSILLRYNYFQCYKNLYLHILSSKNTRLVEYLISNNYSIETKNIKCDPVQLMTYLNYNTELSVENPSFILLNEIKINDIDEYKSDFTNPALMRLYIMSVPLNDFIYLFRSGYYFTNIYGESRTIVEIYYEICANIMVTDRCDLMEYLIQSGYGCNISSYVIIYYRLNRNLNNKVKKYLDNNTKIMKAKNKYTEVINSYSL